MENLKAWNDKEKDHNRSQEESHTQSMPKFDQGSIMRDAGKMMKGAGTNFPSMPSMPNLPNFGNLKF